MGQDSRQGLNKMLLARRKDCRAGFKLIQRGKAFYLKERVFLDIQICYTSDAKKRNKKPTFCGRTLNASSWCDLRTCDLITKSEVTEVMKFILEFVGLMLLRWETALLFEYTKDSSKGCVWKAVLPGIVGMRLV